MQLDVRTSAAPVLTCLREATGDLHRRLEARFDAVGELADPKRKPGAIARYKAFYASAHAALAPSLAEMEGLDFSFRVRSWRSIQSPAPVAQVPDFPAPANPSEALGSCYVVEGSTLGGRIILRELDRMGAADPELAFLDPYGSAAGSMWRSLLAVLERDGARGPAHLQSLCRGAVRGFAHAERVLCGDLA